MTLGLGIIGAGGVAAIHADAAARTGLRVATVCDVDVQRAEALAAEHPGAAATGDAQAIFDDPDVAAVVVAVPNALHKDLAIAAMRAGKDVLLEKPMALNAGECDEIIAARDETGRLLQMGFVCRCAPSSEAARALVEQGRLGRIYHAQAGIFRQRGIPGLGRWFTTRAMSGGGALMDLGVHLIDLVLHLTGYPRPVTASAVCTSTFGSPIKEYAFEAMWGGPPDPGGVFDVEDGVTALVRLDSGMSMELQVMWAANISEERLPSRVVLFGEAGGCLVDPWSNELFVTRQQGGRIVGSAEKLPGGEGWEAAWLRQAEVFARNVTDRTPPEASAEDGWTVQALIDALYRSAAEGREVTPA